MLRLAGAPESLCAVPVARRYYAQVVCVALRLAVAAWAPINKNLLELAAASTSTGTRLKNHPCTRFDGCVGANRR